MAAGNRCLALFHFELAGIRHLRTQPPNQWPHHAAAAAAAAAAATGAWLASWLGFYMMCVCVLGQAAVHLPLLLLHVLLDLIAGHRRVPR